MCISIFQLHVLKAYLIYLQLLFEEIKLVNGTGTSPHQFFLIFLVQLILTFLHQLVL